MTILWGGLLAAGVLFVLSPWLWPSTGATASRTSPRPFPLLEEAGLAHVRPRVIVATGLVLGTVAAALAFLVTGVWPLVVVAAAAAACAPIGWLRARRRRLRRERRTLWPDVCDLLIASVRAGMSLPDAVASLSTSAPPALRPAFVDYDRDLAASGHFDASVLRLKTTLSDPTSDRIIETLRMARQVGGTELVPVLRSLAASVRADAALRGEVESRQSWTRGAAVLGLVAPWAIVVLLAFRPEGFEAYTSPEGVLLILVGAIVSFVAFRVMLRIGALPELRRWFG